MCHSPAMTAGPGDGARLAGEGAAGVSLPCAGSAFTCTNLSLQGLPSHLAP